MAEGEHRQITRDSLFVLADLRIIGEPGEHRVKIRNLSSGGLMAEGDVRVQRGALVTTRYGKGRWVYVGLGLWRELPAGVAGAYQLLANLLTPVR